MPNPNDFVIFSPQIGTALALPTTPEITYLLEETIPYSVPKSDPLVSLHEPLESTQRSFGISYSSPADPLSPWFTATSPPARVAQEEDMEVNTSNAYPTHKIFGIDHNFSMAEASTGSSMGESPGSDFMFQPSPNLPAIPLTPGPFNFAPAPEDANESDEPLENNPKAIKAALERLQTALLGPKYYFIIKGAKKILDIAPDNYHAYRYLAEANLGLMQFREALNAAQKAFELCGPDIEAQIYIHKIAIKAKLALRDFQGVIYHAESIIHLNPNDYYGYAVRAEASSPLANYDNIVKYATAAIDKGFELNLEYVQIAPLCYIRIIANNSRQNYRAAIQDILQALALEPNNYHAKELYANIRKSFAAQATHKVYNNFNDAIVDYTLLIELGALYFYKKRATAYLQTGNFMGAIADATAATGLNFSPTDAIEIYTCRAIAWKNLNEPRRALEDIAQVLRLHPENEDIKPVHSDALALLKEQAQDNYNAGNTQAAFDEFSLLIDKQPKNKRPDNQYFYYRAKLGMILGNYNQAFIDINRFLAQLRPNNPLEKESISIRGLASALQNNFDGALIDANRIEAIDTNHYSSSQIRMIVAFNTKNPVDCVFQGNAALARNPPLTDTVYIYKMLSQAFMQLGKFDHGLVTIGNILEIEPTNAFALNRKIQIHNLLKSLHVQDVIEHLHQSARRRLSGDIYGALIETHWALNIITQQNLDKEHLALCLYERAQCKMLSDLSAAVEDLSYAINLAPQNIVPYYSMRAHARWLNKDTSGSVIDYLQMIPLLKEDKDLSEVYLRLTDIFESTGNILASKEFLLKYLALNPKHLDSEERLYKLLIKANQFAEATACMARIIKLKHSDLVLETDVTVPSQTTHFRAVVRSPFELNNTTYAAAVFFYLPGRADPSTLIFPKTIHEIRPLRNVIKNRNKSTINELFGLLKRQSEPDADRTVLDAMLKTRFTVPGVGETNIIMAMFLLGDDEGQQKRALLRLLDTQFDHNAQTFALEPTVTQTFYSYTLPMLIAKEGDLIPTLLKWLNTGPLTNILWLIELFFIVGPENLTLSEQISHKSNQVSHIQELLKIYDNVTKYVYLEHIIYALTRLLNHETNHLGTLATLLVIKSHGYATVDVNAINKHFAVTTIQPGDNEILSLLGVFIKT